MFSIMSKTEHMIRINWFSYQRIQIPETFHICFIRSIEISTLSFYNVLASKSIPCLISFNPVPRLHVTEKISEPVHSMVKSGWRWSSSDSKILFFCPTTSSLLQGVASLSKWMSAWWIYPQKDTVKWHLLCTPRETSGTTEHHSSTPPCPRKSSA